MSNARPLPSQRLLRALLRYDPESGKLYWRERPRWMFPATGRGGRAANCKRWNAQYAGKEALTKITVFGYIAGCLLGRDVFAHRVIFKMLHGYDADEVDHDNGDPQDNRPRNLIDRTSSGNNRNRSIPSTNTSGVMGVCRNRQRGKWIAYIRGQNGRIVHLGYFERLEDAADARRRALAEHGYHPNHGRRRA